MLAPPSLFAEQTDGSMATTPSHDDAPLSADQMHAGTAAHGESSGLPQFEFGNWAGQILYLLILFLALYLLISRVFAPRLRRVMDARAETISSAIATARQVQTEAAEQAAVAKVEVEQARASSRATVVAARARVTAEANARAAAEEAVVSARIAEAEAVIAKTRDAAMTHVGTIASDTVVAIVDRLTGKSPTAAEAAAAVKGAA